MTVSLQSDGGSKLTIGSQGVLDTISSPRFMRESDGVAKLILYFSGVIIYHPPAYARRQMREKDDMKATHVNEVVNRCV